MFQGSMSSGALSVIESSLSVRLTSGENISTAAGRLWEFMLMRWSTVPNKPPPPESPARISRSGARPSRPSGSSRRGCHPQRQETETPAPAGSRQQRRRIRSLAPGGPRTGRTSGVTCRYSPHRGDTRWSPVTEPLATSAASSLAHDAAVGTKARARHRDCPVRP